MSQPREVIHTSIWQEEPEPDNPFAAAVCYCRGYDVYGDILGRGSWPEYLYLLFHGERPDQTLTRLLEGLAVALANPGPRDHSVRAAMNGGAGGSTAASCLMAALAVGAGQLGGAHEVYRAMEGWVACGRNLDAWRERLRSPPREDRADIWSPPEHPPGFDPHGASCATPVRQTLAYLADQSPGGALPWLQAQRAALEAAADCPLAMTGVAAAALIDLGLDPPAGEMLFLLLRLPGAAVHALEQVEAGWRKYPFFRDAVILADDADPGYRREEDP
ncbi:MAG: citryl-CoA lyase [Chromatiales bacterium 21-64-14]|nr:MAG: citryl-CoA lyase [Chromatiales bacterium 21-64-14]HQU15585.1 citryl-CoA lyase [Gammaproteobacteria bacterium]